MKLEINNVRKTRKHIDNKQHSSENQWIKEKIKGERKNFVINKKGNTIHENLWDKAKAVLIRKFTAINA